MKSTLGTIIHGGPVDESEVKRVRDLLLYEGAIIKYKMVRFFCLLILAASIATFGLLGNSLAVVIGAMIVAPLMQPIMGLAFSVSIGDRRTITSSLLVSLGGILTAIAVGFILTLPMARLIQPESIDQIMIRTAPRLMDLLAALATGFAGAFAISRKDVSDTLPGVAIAVSLVPPLANVGILLALGKTSLALGSLLLFVTNYLAILLTGSLIFGLMGFSQVAILDYSSRAKRKAIVIALVALLIMRIPLTYTSYTLIINNTITARVYRLGNEWLEDTGYRLISVNAETADNTVYVVILGDGDLPDTALFEEQSRELLFGRSLRIETIQSSSYTIK